MKVRYKGESFGVDSLTNDKTYDCIGVEFDLLRIIDDSGEDYAPLDGSSSGGRWEIVEDDAVGTLAGIIPN